MPIDERVLAAAKHGMRTLLSDQEMLDYIPVFYTDKAGRDRWSGIICADCKRERGTGHDKECETGKRGG